MRNLFSRLLPVTVTAAALFAAGCASTQPETKPESKAVAETKPAASAPAPSAAPTSASASMASYNVVRGDHLWGISSKPTIYGNPYQWPLIFKANRDKIQDADLIEPGQMLSVEKNPSSGDISGAVAHAKTRGAWSLNSTESTDLAYLRGYNLK